ncbi:DUF924 family protein [Pseudacidovorax intermedius]|uniref:DUF924 domain-containing protein n=1 Tax=Pseudacidovorax intermedius TaxID=433924 RepID=A0A147GLZ7_9BURK|nr:DUF924 family protein [Pseudacidovorax intermedius]KTT14489.1 hypothetical protein NS331_23585 [Pseudacidovorax intermedius]
MSPTSTATTVPPEAAALVDFWRASEPHWFRKSDAFDAEFFARGFQLHLSAARGELDAWLETPAGALALLLLLDQFPRNAFRGTANMYATDARARAVAREALARGHEMGVDAPLRLFFCLPFAHSEALDDQQRSVRLYERLAPEALRHGEEHRDIVQRFGRFPHRNAILLRESTPEELAFLAEGGFAG